MVSIGFRYHRPASRLHTSFPSYYPVRAAVDLSWDSQWKVVYDITPSLGPIFPTINSEPTIDYTCPEKPS